MRMWKQLAAKAVLNGVVTVPLLLWFSDRVSIGMAVLTSVLLTVLAYGIGDRMILPTSDNVIATVSDALLTFMVVWLAAYYAEWTFSFSELCVISAAVGVVEFGFHRYLQAHERMHA